MVSTTEGTTEVQFGEDLGTFNKIKSSLQQRKGVGVMHRDIVPSSVVNARAQPRSRLPTKKKPAPAGEEGRMMPSCRLSCLMFRGKLGTCGPLMVWNLEESLWHSLKDNVEGRTLPEFYRKRSLNHGKQWEHY